MQTLLFVVLYGQPLSVAELENSLPSFDPGALVPHLTTVDATPFNSWEHMEEDATYWNGMVGEEGPYEIILEQQLFQTDGSIGQPLPLNRRVSAPQPPAFIVIDDDHDDIADTGSSSGGDAVEVNAALRPPVPILVDSLMETKNSNNVLAG